MKEWSGIERMETTEDYPYYIPTPLHIVDRRAHKSWSVPKGRRSFHNFLLIVEGEGTAWTEDTPTPLAPGMLVYHPENEEFGYETSREHYLRVMGGNFSVSALCRDLELSRVEALPIPTYSRPANYERLVRLFTDLSLAWGNGIENDMLICRSIFMRILSELKHVHPPDAEERRNAERIEQVIAYMETHYERKLSLKTMAELVGLSPSYFGQTFRRVTGKTPLEYLNTIRVERALQWMEQGLSLSESSAKAGFHEPFYFSRVCKKIKGASPSDYRNRSGYL